MKAKGLTVNLSLRDIKALLCDDCTGKLRVLIKDNLTDEMVDQILDEAG